MTSAGAQPVRPLLPAQTDQPGPVDGSDEDQGERGPGDGEPGQAEVEADENEEIETHEDEVLAQRPLRTPYTPSASEVAQHRADGHNPYRDWCEECNDAFGREMAHRDVHHESVWVPVISCDYLFLSARGVYHRREWEPIEGEQFLKVLVIYDSSSKCIFARAVPQKGVDDREYTVDCFVACILWLGRARAILRSDNEPAIIKLVSA